MKTSLYRIIAFYLPQFHPIPENDKWWGKGFTEWTNVGKAKPLFRGHYQPKVPADLGYYDLRIPEVREKQAEMARKYGIEGFCYWHYWFGNGKRLLERPFNEVLKSGEPDFPFCLAWANETWKGFNHGLKNRNILIEQLYPGIEDYTNHFFEVLPAFKDKRYIRVDDKPIFMIFKPMLIPDVKLFINHWRKLALDNGLKGIYFIGHSAFIETKGQSFSLEADKIINLGFDAVNSNKTLAYVNLHRSFIRKIREKMNKILRGIPSVYEYSKMINYFVGEEDKREDVFPTLCPNWDHTPRSGKEGVVFHNSTPELFEKHVKQVFQIIKHKPDDRQIIFLKSWNEWAEGNYVEPDLRYGKAYLEVIKRNINS